MYVGVRSYKSRENSTVGTEVSYRTDKKGAAGYPRSYQIDDALKFPAKTGKLVRPLQLPFNSGRFHKSSSPPAFLMPQDVSVLKRRQQMSNNASMIEQLEARLGNNVKGGGSAAHNTFLFEDSP